MQKIILIITMLFTFTLNAQTIKEYLQDDYIKKNWVKCSLLYTAGAADGQVEVLRHHYGNFKKMHPNVNDQYWNPKISWRNKWYDKKSKNGEAFPLSSTALVWTTDAYHLLRSTNKTCIITAITIDINKVKYNKHAIKKKKFKHYLTDYIIYSTCYTAGFWTTYEILYN